MELIRLFEGIPGRCQSDERTGNWTATVMSTHLIDNNCSTVGRSVKDNSKKSRRKIITRKLSKDVECPSWRKDRPG